MFTIRSRVMSSLLLGLLVQLCSLELSHGVLIGDSCKNVTDCDNGNNGMTCYFPTLECGCKYQSHSYFDYGDQTCKIKAGEPCDPDNVDGKCTPNAFCDVSKGSLPRCQCFQAFTLTENGKCIHGYGESCSSTGNCDRDKFLVCNSNYSCDCEPGSKFEPLLDTCVINVNGDCRFDNYTERCDFYSTCNQVSPGIVPGSCLCNDGMFLSVDGACVNGFNETCNPGLPDSCDKNEYLQCGIDYRCECFNPLTQYYDNDARQCKVKAGERCLGTPDYPQCTEYATCRSVSDGSGANNYYCLCQNGTVISRTEKCVIPYGNYCQYGTINRPKCDLDHFMDCNAGSYTCRCMDSFNAWYDPDVNECYRLARASCTPPSLNPAAQRCTPNSECRPNGLGIGVCTCLDGVYENKDRKCYLPHGSACNPSNDICDTSAFLTCNPTTLTCECDNLEYNVYEPESRGCVVKAGMPCNSTVFSRPCAQSSQCTFKPGGISYCECGAGLSVGLGGKCVRQYGETCDVNGYGPEVCDPDGYQQCSLGGFCECSDPLHMVYNEINKKCHLTLNSPCAASGVPCDSELACYNNLCECDYKQGLVENSFGECTKAWATPCQDDRACSQELYLKCINGQCFCSEAYSPVTVGNMTRCIGNINADCRNEADCNSNGALFCGPYGKCQCYNPDELTYYSPNNTCKSIKGARCHKGLSSGSDPVRMDCWPGLVCKNSVDPIYGICECDWLGGASGLGVGCGAEQITSGFTVIISTWLLGKLNAYLAFNL